MKKEKRSGGIGLLFTLLLWVIQFFVHRERFALALDFLLLFVIEMLQILPFILILTALLNQWVPRETVRRHLGAGAGWRGAFFAYFLGSLSAGPIYAAFPIVLSLKKKGASVGNLTVLISTWAAMKFPMLFMETKFLGLRFTLIRYILTLPAIMLMAALLNRLVGPEEMTGDELLHAEAEG